jgi:hypothetical protein
MRFGTSDTPTVAMIRSFNVGVTSAIDNGVSALAGTLEASGVCGLVASSFSSNADKSQGRISS